MFNGNLRRFRSCIYSVQLFNCSLLFCSAWQGQHPVLEMASPSAEEVAAIEAELAGEKEEEEADISADFSVGDTGRASHHEYQSSIGDG